METGPRLMQADSEAASVALARAGDQEAFRRLVDQYSRSLFRVAYRITGHVADAEDVVQEAFVRAYKQLPRFEERSRFGTWIYRIAANCAVDLMRSRPRREESLTVTQETDRAAADRLPSLDVAPDRAVFSLEISREVSEALNELSETERAAFVLRHFEEKSIEEIGQILGLRTSATKHSIFRAVRKLRATLGPILGASSGTAIAGRAHQASNLDLLA